MDRQRLLQETKDGQEFVLNVAENQMTIVEGPSAVGETLCMGWRAVNLYEENARKLMKSDEEMFTLYLSYGYEMINMCAAFLNDAELSEYISGLHGTLADEYYMNQENIYV